MVLGIPSSPLQKDDVMKKLLISTAVGLAVALPLALLSGTANAREGFRGGQAGGGEVVQHDGAATPGDSFGSGSVQQGVVDHPVADAEAIRIARENADDDNDGIINANDPDDDNDGVPDTEEGASGAGGAQ
jgi:hypothetical protein